MLVPIQLLRPYGVVVGGGDGVRSFFGIQNLKIIILV